MNVSGSISGTVTKAKKFYYQSIAQVIDKPLHIHQRLFAIKFSCYSTIFYTDQSIAAALYTALVPKLSLCDDTGIAICNCL